MKGNWLSLESDNYTIIYPDLDSGPHGKKVTEVKYDLDVAECACKPLVYFQSVDKLDEEHELVTTFDKAFVVHHAWDGRE